MSFAQMSFMGAVMILSVVVIRIIAINKLLKKVFLLLWEIIMIRLSIPFCIPFGASVYNIFNHGKDLTVQYSVETNINFPTVTTADFTAAAEIISESKSVSVWFVIWITGFILCLFGFLSLYVICYKKFCYSEKIDSSIAAKLIKDMNIKRKIKICLSNNISSPLTYGIFKPVILLPKNIYTNEHKKLDFIFKHELIHIKRFDMVRKIIMVVVLCIHWFNPFVWIMYLLYNRDIELVCDETVIKSSSEDCRSGYAMALIDMEEKKCGITSIYSNFSKNSIEERIVAIMKTKKINFATGVAACFVIFGVTSVFATSADTQSIKDKVVLSLEETGAINSSDIEWWTYDEYKKWFEEEKKELQSLLGSSAWTSSDGHFIWTQEKIDETIAMYEETLQQIKDGVKISKPTAYGDIVISLNELVTEENTDNKSNNAVVIAKSEHFSEYEKYGLSFDSTKKALMYDGETVGYFKDEYKKGAYIRSIIDGGTIGVIVVRDGDYNITGLEKTDIPVSSTYAVETNDVYYLNEKNSQKNSTSVISDKDLFSRYSAYGISFNQDREMLYNGDKVRLFCDGTEVGDGFASRYLYLNEKGTADVFTKYEATDNGDGSFDPFGKLIGLEKSSQEEFDKRDLSSYSLNDEVTYTEQIASDYLVLTDKAKSTEITVAEGNSAASGEPFSEKFSKYKKYGIEYKEENKGSGIGNVYYNGELVKQFSDITPNGGAFTYMSKDGGKISVSALYDNNGVLCGVKK